MRAQPRTSNIIGTAISAIAAAGLAFAMLGGTALAAPPVVRDHIVSSGAFAGNNVCVGTICTATSVYVVVNIPDGPTQACLDISRFDSALFVPLGYETGCAPLAQSAFWIDTKSLAGATLAPIDITLDAFTCGATGCLPTGTTRVAHVSATYAGTGVVNTFRSNSKSTFGACSMYFVGKGTSREASATLSIGTQSLDALGSLFTSTQKTKVICH